MTAHKLFNKQRGLMALEVLVALAILSCTLAAMAPQLISLMHHYAVETFKSSQKNSAGIRCHGSYSTQFPKRMRCTLGTAQVEFCLQ